MYEQSVNVFSNENTSTEEERNSTPCNLSEFEKAVLDDLISIRRKGPEKKFTRPPDENRILSESDNICCQVLGTAIADIVKQSMDNGFKENCFAASCVDSSLGIKKVLTTKLLSLSYEHSVVHKTYSKRC